MRDNLLLSANSLTLPWGILYSFFYIANKKFYLSQISFILPLDHWFPLPILVVSDLMRLWKGRRFHYCQNF